VNDLQIEYNDVVKSAKIYEEKLASSVLKELNMDEATQAEYNKLKEQLNAKTIDQRQKVTSLKRDMKSDEDNYNRLKEKIDEFELKKTNLSQYQLLGEEKRKEVRFIFFHQYKSKTFQDFK
jgi:hypothetical protein